MSRIELMCVAFTLVGAALQTLSVRRAARAKRVVGVHWAPPIFFTCWNAFDVYFFASLGQQYASAAMVVLCTVNLVYLGYVLRYDDSTPRGTY